MTLPDYIAAHLRTPFCWGKHDCIKFTIGWVQLATGKNHLEELPGWSSEAGAMRIVKKLGGLEKAFDKKFERINPNFACDGDLALIGTTAYLFSGPQVVSVGKQGLIFNSRTEATCAWRY